MMEDQQNRIRDEYLEKEKWTVGQLFAMIEHSDSALCAHHFFFYMTNSSWKLHFGTLFDRLKTTYPTSDVIVRKNIIEFLTLLSIGLKSFLGHIHLRNTIGQQGIDAAFNEAIGLLLELEAQDPDIAKTLCEEIIATNTKQFVAEGVSSHSAESEASIIVGYKPSQYVQRLVKKIHSSNFFAYSLAQWNKPERTILGNDYGEFLQYSMWLGYSFQTTNPPLIKMIWDMDTQFWRAKLLQVMKGEFGSGDLEHTPIDLGKACSLAALIVVEKSCRLLRDWFLFSEGKEGYVCYQVNPEKNGDAQAMVDEALFVHAVLMKRLGGIPNVSFKLPGTHAGLQAAQELGSKGFSLTITLNFTTFQAMEFAKVFKSSKALTSYIVVMNGRLSFPVRDELQSLDTEIDPKSSWLAGVEVARHIYGKLYTSAESGGLALDSGKIKLLNASLRIYGNEIPDISGIWGTGLITIFPNVRRAYDFQKRSDSTFSINDKTSDATFDDLCKSELFRQAWWVPGDPEKYKPIRALSLSPEDEEAVLEWTPIKDTLKQFNQEYNNLKVMVSEMLASGK
jgi:transaldolase